MVLLRELGGLDNFLVSGLHLLPELVQLITGLHHILMDVFRLHPDLIGALQCLDLLHEPLFLIDAHGISLELELHLIDGFLDLLRAHTRGRVLHHLAEQVALIPHYPPLIVHELLDASALRFLFPHLCVGLITRLAQFFDTLGRLTNLLIKEIASTFRLVNLFRAVVPLLLQFTNPVFETTDIQECIPGSRGLPEQGA